VNTFLQHQMDVMEHEMMMMMELPLMAVKMDLRK
jgi:hypothetical protein